MTRLVARHHLFQAINATIAGFMVDTDELVNNVLLDLRLPRFLKELTQ